VYWLLLKLLDEQLLPVTALFRFGQFALPEAFYILVRGSGPCSRGLYGDDQSVLQFFLRAFHYKRLQLRKWLKPFFVCEVNFRLDLRICRDRSLKSDGTRNEFNCRFGSRIQVSVSCR